MLHSLGSSLIKPQREPAQADARSPEHSLGTLSTFLVGFLLFIYFRKVNTLNELRVPNQNSVSGNKNSKLLTLLCLLPERPREPKQ